MTAIWVVASSCASEFARRPLPISRSCRPRGRRPLVRQRPMSPCGWLPRGATYLNVGSSSTGTAVDLRGSVGNRRRSKTMHKTRCACDGGRPPIRGSTVMHRDATANQAALMHSLSRAKFVLAFSNKAARLPTLSRPGSTLTVAGTDSLASGACSSSRTAAEARFDHGCSGQVRHSAGDVSTLAEGVRVESPMPSSWDPEIARENHSRLAQRSRLALAFQGAWRTLSICDHPGLEADLETLARALEE